MGVLQANQPTISDSGSQSVTNGDQCGFRSLLYCRTLSLYKAEDSGSSVSDKLLNLDLNILLLQFMPSIGILLTYKQHHCVELNFPNLTVYNT